MATFSFAALSPSMPQLYRELRPQFQRKAPTLRLLPCKQVTTGQNIGWDVTFDGQAAAAVNSDGGPLLSATSDPQVAATLGFGEYSAPIRVTTKAQATGSAIAVQGYDFLKQLIDRNTLEALNKLVKVLNQDTYKGAGAVGSVNQMTGLSTAISGSGAYATINPATAGQSNWASYSSGNGGSLRSLTLAMLKTAVSTIATNAPSGRPDLALVPPALMNSLENLFDAFLHIYGQMNNGVTAPQFNNGGNQMGADTVTQNPPTIVTAGGQIQRTGFRVLYWQNQDLYFVEDPDCTNTALTNANNCIFFTNSSATEYQFLPPSNIQNYMPDQKVIQAVEQDLGPIANLQVDFRARGRTAFADEFDILAYLQTVVKDRAATGILFDVQ